MVDPLLSLSQEVNEQDLPGYVTLGDTSESDFDGSDDDENAPEDDSDDQEFQEIPITPKTPEKINWATVATAPFNIRIIQRYQEYVALRIEASIVSGVRLTPSVAHVHEKSRKATEVLMINGITSTEEMKRLKEKNLRRRVLQQGTQIEGRRIPWESGITVVTPLNRNRWNLNIEATLAFQRQWQAPLRIFVSEHKWKDGQPTEEEALMMLGQGDDSAIPVPAMFKFFPGMPVIVNQNTHQGLKLVNGASYTAAEVVLDKGHLGHRIDADIVLHFGPPAGILLASGTTRDFRFVGMP
ncbi:hypothetical protein ACJ41O_001224 [Fusarium nematophilum]